MFSSTKSDRPIAYTQGDSKATDKRVYLHEDSPVNSYEADKNERLVWMPPVKGKRSILYVCGASGSGKSYWVAEQVKAWIRYKSRSQIYLLSSLDSDPAFDAMEKAGKLHRVKINQSLIDDPINISEIEPDSLVIADDVEVLAKPLLKAVYKIIHTICEIGRHTAISMIVISHLINGSDRNHTRTLHNESAAITVFPRGVSRYGLNYYARNYLGLSKKEADKLVDVPSRHITISKNFPPFVMTDRRIYRVEGM